MQSIVEFWKSFNPTGGARRHLHPRDAPVFRDPFEEADTHHTHLELLPIPYLGDLAKADIFTVFLHPGYDKRDYEAEKDPEFFDHIVNCLKQNFDGVAFPVPYFDPKFRSYPCYKWAEKMFGEVMGADLAQRLAILEVYPYHCEEFGYRSVQKRLPSVHAMREYIQVELVPRVRRDQITLVVTMGATLAGFAKENHGDERNLVIYRGAETRRGSLKPNTRGGEAILHKLER